MPASVAEMIKWWSCKTCAREIDNFGNVFIKFRVLETKHIFEETNKRSKAKLTNTERTIVMI